MKQDCIFCKIIRGEVPSEKVYEGEYFIVIKDIRQKVKGHSLVIPRKHYDTFLDMPSSLYASFMQTTHEAAKILMKQYKAEGFNLSLNNGAVAGQAVLHVHLHILPRVQGDGINWEL